MQNCGLFLKFYVGSKELYMTEVSWSPGKMYMLKTAFTLRKRDVVLFRLDLRICANCILIRNHREIGSAY